MSPLIKFVLRNMALGAVFGCAAAATLVGNHWAVLVSIQSRTDALIGVGLFFWGFASTFALGYLSTAMNFLPAEPASRRVFRTKRY